MSNSRDAPARNCRPRVAQKRNAQRRVALRSTQAVAAVLVVLFVWTGASFAQSAKDKPRVPPRGDPGGVAVAIIGNGIDYTRPEIAARLARDGEGEIIGWDFLDNDRRPYARCDDGEQTSFCSILAKMLIVGGAPAGGPRLRLVVLRGSSQTPQSLVQAVQVAAQTPARIVLLALDDPPPPQFLPEAARRYPHLVFLALTTVDSPVAERQSDFSGDNYFLFSQGRSAGPGNPASAKLVAVATAEAAAACVAANPQLNAAAVLSCALKQMGFEFKR